MKPRSSLAAILIVLCSAAPAAAVCVDPHPPGFVSHRVVLGVHDVEARPDDSDAADRVRSRLQLADPWPEWQRLFSLGAGTTVTPALSAGVYPVVVLPHCQRPHEDTCLADLVGGLQAPICGHPDRTGIQVLNDMDADEANYVLAHELFHTFQSATAGGTIGEGWWVEATAEWGSSLLWGYRSRSELRDTRFFHHPELPLDDFDHPEATPDHPYGAWRFVQWAQLHRFAGDEAGLWRMLAGSFRRMRFGRSGALPQEAALRRSWSGFSEALGRFWFDHLEATTDNGPAATATRWTAGTAGRSQTFRMQHLSARLLKIGLRSSVPRVTVKVRAIGGAHQLWLRDGSVHRVTARTYSRTFCARDFPSDFAIADTNTASHAAALRVQVIARTATGCRQPPPPTTCSRAAHAAQSCTPPPATGASCDSARAGVYRNKAPDAYGFYEPPYVTFDLICAPSGLELNGFGGLLSDDNCHNVNLGPSGGSYRVGKLLAPDGSVDFSYTYNSDHHVTGHLQVAGAGATGTVSVTTPTCHIDYPFNAVWYE